MASFEGPGRRFVNKAAKKSGQAWGQSTAISALSEAQAQTEVTLSWLSETASPAFRRRAASCFGSPSLGPSSPTMQRISRRASKRQSFFTSCLNLNAGLENSGQDPKSSNPGPPKLKLPDESELGSCGFQAALRGRPGAAPPRAGPGRLRRPPGPHLNEHSPSQSQSQDRSRSLGNETSGVCFGCVVISPNGHT